MVRTPKNIYFIFWGLRSAVSYWGAAASEVEKN